MPWVYEKIGRGSGAATEVFISTTDGKIGIIPHQIDFHRTRRMGKIPHHQRADFLSLLHQPAHIPSQTRPIVHIGNIHHRNIFIEAI